MTTIAIVGAGFSGTLLALHALRQCPSPTRIVLVERNARFGRGQAYSTGNSSHLLNVPAGRMSAFHDRPLDFLHWLQAQRRETDAAATPGCFVSRRLFGAYVRHLLKQELRRPDLGSQLELVRGDVLEISAEADPLVLTLDRGRTLRAGLAVLAVGNFPPEPPRLADPGFYDGPLYHADPWAPDALAGLDPDAPVLLIGTGLTMVDVVISLLDQGHRGPIHALSRRGLLPHRHAAAPPRGPAEAPPLSTTLTKLLRAVRQAAERSGTNGWQPVIDGLRPFTVDLWQALSTEDRQRFLRHLRRWWDVHRHRMAGSVADRIDAARARGQLRIHAGWLRSLAMSGGAAEATFVPRCGTRLESLRAARVVNCSGPGADYGRIEHPLVQALLRDGLVRPDPLRLGLDVTGNCSLLSRDGVISRRLFAAGPVTRGTFWEMTAVPDLRRQCEALATHLATLVKVSAAQPSPMKSAMAEQQVKQVS